MLDKSVSHKLIEHWRNCCFEAPPFVLPEDESEIANRISVYRSFDEFIASPTFGQRRDTSLHVGLLPIPFIGVLGEASVFILMLNPGLAPGDYFAERIPEFRTAHLRNLRQENSHEEFPFFFLAPRFAWHPGFTYWQGKMHDIALALVKKEQISYQEALRHIAQRIACLQLMPYHSKVFGAGSLLGHLSSTKLMLEYVSDVVLPKAHCDNAVVIVARGARHWKESLRPHKNIIIYEGSVARSAHLTLKSNGGSVIAKRLGL
jgi:hypothetical protein